MITRLRTRNFKSLRNVGLSLGLVAWEKVRLAPGESKAVTLDLDPFYLSIFNADKGAWELAPGEYIIHAGGSSRDLPLRGSIHLD
jgi:beta-glucosidase